MSAANGFEKKTATACGQRKASWRSVEAIHIFAEGNTTGSRAGAHGHIAAESNGLGEADVGARRGDIASKCVQTSTVLGKAACGRNVANCCRGKEASVGDGYQTTRTNRLVHRHRISGNTKVAAGSDPPTGIPEHYVIGITQRNVLTADDLYSSNEVVGGLIECDVVTRSRSNISHSGNQ